QLHSEGAPSKLRPAIGVLTAWGSLRSWTCCGHYHENPENDLINLIESLSGLAFDVRFLSFDDIRSGVPEDINVIINAGFAGSAWSGGAEWHSEHVTALTAWTHQGGVLLGVGEPSALCGNDTFFRMAQVLGVDIDTGERVNHGRWSYEVSGSDIRFEGAKPHQGIYLTNANTQVLGCVDNLPVFTTHKFGSGLGVYLASYRHSAENASALKKLILETCGCEDICSCPDPGIECATFPNSKQAVVINNSPKATEAAITHGSCKMQVKLKPYGMAIVEMNS
ncbi:MAG: D-galactosyl-beta-1-4-L-rhamnose phosphorylase, partial [Oscillospiraceae bacterium]|nr:D-galactosyl-beta-1-4-L-rhamnose phosphorylase [Oscillospiraceae bacterium]